VVKYGPVQGCVGNRDWRIMAVDDEIVCMEETDSSKKDDQSELEPHWQGEEDETKGSRHTITTKVKGIWAVTN